MYRSLIINNLNKSTIIRVPKVKLVYDRRHQATPEKEGAVDLRVCFDCKQKFLSTGVKVYKEWGQNISICLGTNE